MPTSSPPSPSAAASSRPPKRRLRLGFLASFTLVGVLAIAALTFGLSHIIGTQMRTDELDRARDSARLLAESAIAPTLLPALDRGDVSFRRLDEIVVAAKPSGGFDTVVVLDRRGKVVYANDHRLIGRQTGLTPVATEALAGAVALRVQNGPQGAADMSRGKQIAVAIPLTRPGSRQTAVVVEVHAPYAPVESVVATRVRNLQLLLLGVGCVLFAALWPRLLAASRALRRQADPVQEALIRDLRRGLERDELVVHFQPKISLRGGRVSGMEALVRWNHPEQGMLAPDKFLPAAMEGELTGPLTIHVADLSLRACRAWRERGIDAGVDINLGAANVLDERLPSELGRLLGRWGLPPEALGVEITESAIAADPVRAGAVLDSLHEMGLRIAIDDFGTGYTSLAGLRTLPVDELKVDRSFVSGLTTNASDAAIVRSVVGLAHELGVAVIAEGVEDEATVRHLAGIGCDQAQGYYFGRPMPLAALLTWLAAPRVEAAVGVIPSAPARA